MASVALFLVKKDEVMERFEIIAKTDNLPQVLGFIDEKIEEAGGDMRIQLQIDIAVEEIFVNIASYAYEGKEGMAEILFELNGDCAEITFIDSGVPYDPLAKEDPDITLSAEQRQIGGLGIFMVKKSMDDMKYEYKDNKNCLTLFKKIK